MKIEWATQVSSHALRQAAADTKWQNPKQIPITEDIVKLNTEILETEHAIRSEMKHIGITSKTFSELAKCTFAQVILYNRRPRIHKS